MRIHLKTTPTVDLIPFNYQSKLVGTLHKWLGTTNEEHGKLSLYSFSWLHNGQRNGKGLVFPKGAKWFISFYDEAKLRLIIKQILNDPDMFSGMSVSDIIIEETPNLSNKNLFCLGSPIFIKGLNANTQKTKQYTYEDEASNNMMVRTLQRKMKIAGIPLDETLNIRFDLNYLKKKTKLVTYKEVDNRANMCPIFIDGKPETKAFAWNVGIGNSTGIGFGSIY